MYLLKYENTTHIRKYYSILFRYIDAHRRYGYKYANLNPVAASTASTDDLPPELKPELYNIDSQVYSNVYFIIFF